MRFSERIYPEQACNVVDLNDEELKGYRGSGWAIAHVAEGQITQLVYLDHLDLDRVEAHAKEAIEEAARQPEAWFGMCSSSQFSKPELIILDNAALIARIMRLAVDPC